MNRTPRAAAVALTMLLAGAVHAADGDARVAVPVAADTLLHERALMRDHLAAMAQIEHDLAAHRFDEAARVAQMHLGLSVMTPQQMRRMHRDMPQSMQDIGMRMHRAGENLAVQIQNAAVTGDAGPAVQALSKVTAQCVSCHAAYRFTLRDSSELADPRAVVALPRNLQTGGLAIMRGHLATLGSVQARMSMDDWRAAAQAVDAGMLRAMTSPTGAAVHARMPQGMGQIAQSFGQAVTAFHASLEQPGAGMDQALQAMATVTDNCVACHAAYRFEAQPSCSISRTIHTLRCQQRRRRTAHHGNRPGSCHTQVAPAHRLVAGCV